MRLNRKLIYFLIPAALLLTLAGAFFTSCDILASPYLDSIAAKVSEDLSPPNVTNFESYADSWNNVNKKGTISVIWDPPATLTGDTNQILPTTYSLLVKEGSDPLGLDDLQATLLVDNTPIVFEGTQRFDFFDANPGTVYHFAIWAFDVNGYASEPLRDTAAFMVTTLNPDIDGYITLDNLFSPSATDFLGVDLKVGHDSAMDNYHKILMHFNVAGVGQLLNAALLLKCSYTDAAVPEEYTLLKITEPWTYTDTAVILNGLNVDWGNILNASGATSPGVVIEMNITNFVSGWVTDPSTNYGLFVNADLAAAMSVAYYYPNEDTIPENRPVLEIISAGK